MRKITHFIVFYRKFSMTDFETFLNARQCRNRKNIEFYE